MKKKLVSLLAVASIFIGSTFAQFEGKIVYSLDYELPEAMESQRGMLPATMDLLIGKDKTKIVQNTMMGSQIVISDTKTKESVLLMDMMGQKMAINMPAPSKEDLENEKLPTFKYDDKTKKVAGYKCKHAVMLVEDENGEVNEIDVYYTEEIPSEANSKLKGLKGFPLEYSMAPQGMVMTLTAKSVTKEKLPKSEFNVPEGYTSMTMEEFKASMGI